MKTKIIQKPAKWKKTILIILGFLILVVLVFPFLLNIYLKHKLPQLINEKTPYRIVLKDFDLDLYKGNISAHSVDIHTKTTKDPAVTRIEGSLKSIKIEDFGIWKAIFSKSYHVKNIQLIDPDIRVVTGKNRKKKNTVQKKTDFEVENILVTNGNISVKNAEQKDVFNGKNVNVSLTEIRKSKDNSKLPVSFKNFKIDAHDIVVTVNDFYQILAKQIDAKNKQLNISGFHLKPIESPGLYNAKNVFDLKVSQLLADNFIINHDSLIIENTRFTKPQLIVTSTHKQTVKENPKEVNLKIRIKNFDIRQGSVLVQEKNKVKTASVDNFRLNLNDIVFDKNTVKEKVPFAFSGHNIELENIYFMTDPLQAVSVKKISSDNDDVFLDDVQFRALRKSSTKDVFNIKTKKIELLKNKSRFAGQQVQLKFAAINIYQPNVEIIAADHKKKSSNKKKTAAPDLIANLGVVNMINGTFSKKAKGADKIKVGNFNVKLNSVTTDKNILKESIPFHVNNQLITAGKVDVDAGKYYRLKIDGIKNTGKMTQLTNFGFLPKYSREKFNRIIAVEEDLYTIKVKSINITDRNSTFGKNAAVDLDRIIFDGVNCNIFHDLAPPDDVGVRYMFSKKLRDVKFPLFIKQIDIKNSRLAYEEVAEKAQIPGKITFEDFNASIYNVNSARMKGRPTLVKVDSQFRLFGDADTKVQWQFDVTNKNDDYAINGIINDLSVDNANLFVRPYLNVSLDGKIHYLKFDYKGNSKNIGGNFYFKYSDMNVNFMNKNTGKERKLLSAIANVFVKNNSKGEPSHVEVDKERDPNKSFFNTLWQGIMEGLKKYLI